jgi:hypothetical protein
LLTKRKKVAKKEKQIQLKQIYYFCCIKDGGHFTFGTLPESVSVRFVLEKKTLKSVHSYISPSFMLFIDK